MSITQLSFFSQTENISSRFYPKDSKKWNEFMEFHEEHPEVYSYFDKLAREARHRGFKSIGAHLLIQRMRWETFGIGKRKGGYKICNNHFPYYARLFMIKNPDFAGFFNLRKLKEMDND